MVHSLLLTCEMVRFQQVLNAPPGLGPDERQVPARVNGAATAHEDHVIGMAQEALKLFVGDRLAGRLRSRSRRQAARLQLGGQPTAGPFAARVGSSGTWHASAVAK